MKVVIAGGGTGGHLYPGIALAETFLKLQAETQILFIGTSQGIGSSPIPKKGFLFETVAATGFVGKGILARVKAIGAIPIGLLQALKILKNFGPQLVIGIGGYVAVPVMLAATLLRIKRVILEPNVVPGLVNKMVAPLCHLVVTAFEASNDKLYSTKIQRLGIPVRPEITQAKPPRQKEDIQTLLILGGSQGAKSINRAMIESLPFLAEKKSQLSIIHQTGKSDFESIQTEYDQAKFNAKVSPFIDDMASAYSEADLIISRAGAGTLSEIGVVGKPALLIPFPYAGGHQIENAKAFVAIGAAVMVLDQDLRGERLAALILSLLSESVRLENMALAAKTQGKPKAAEEIVTQCIALATDRRI